MSVSLDSGKGGGKKSIEADLNLVPFIDFLSTLISFLLLTSVWIYINKIETSQNLSQASSASSNSNTPPAEEIIFEAWLRKENSSLKVMSNLKPDQALKEMPLNFDPQKGFTSGAELIQQIKDLKNEFPKVKPVVIHAEDEIKYGPIVQMMDFFRAAKLYSIGLSHDGS